MELTLITYANPKRPGATFRISFEDDALYDAWITEYKWIGEGFNKVLIDGEVPNTTIIKHEGFEQIRYVFTWSQVAQLLNHALDMPRLNATPGRPESRVLFQLTSREKRTAGPKRLW